MAVETVLRAMDRGDVVPGGRIVEYTGGSTGSAITPELVARVRDRAYRLAEADDSYYADRFGSPDVRVGYGSLGREILRDLGRVPDVVVAGVGTGGALMGTLDGIDRSGARPDAVALEPSESPFLTTGRGGPHRVEGIGVGFEPPFLERERLREIRAIDQARAFAMARRLAREEGLLVGTSSGLNVAAAIELAMEAGEGATVVTLACDTGIKYLGGALFA